METIFCILLILLLNCESNNKTGFIQNQTKSDSTKNISILYHTIKYKQNSHNIVPNFVPDTTINQKLYLEDYKSFHNFYSGNDNTLTIKEIRESPVAIFRNVSNTQYLLAYQYESGSRNAFDCFEIGYFASDQRLKSKKNYETKIDTFKTESNLYLGMSFKDLIRIKGTNYKTEIHKNKTLIIYRVNDSAVVNRYHMPGYFMKVLIIDSKVFKITFGFDYP